MKKDDKLTLAVVLIAVLGILFGLGSFAVATREHHRTCTCDMVKNRECLPDGP